MNELPEAIVDSHHHLWDLHKIHYPWLDDAYDPTKFILGEYHLLRRNYLPRDFRESWSGMPVIASVHVEAECDRSQALAETQWVHQPAAASGFPNAVIAYVDLLASNADEELDGAENALKLLGGKVEKVHKFNLPCDEGERTIIVIKKVKSTPKQYPRISGKIKSQPL